jgi:hypothetical protein
MPLYRLINCTSIASLGFLSPYTDVTSNIAYLFELVFEEKLHMGTKLPPIAIDIVFPSFVPVPIM